jgi:hypothetical protein
MFLNSSEVAPRGIRHLKNKVIGSLHPSSQSKPVSPARGIPVPSFGHLCKAVYTFNLNRLILPRYSFFPCHQDKLKVIGYSTYQAQP